MRLIIPGIPLAKARAKACVRGKHARVYDPQQVAIKALKCQIKETVGQFPLLVQPIGVHVTFGIPFPKSMSKKKRLHAYPTKRPDTDNYVKLILDVLTGILWKDDAQIVALHAYKVYVDNPSTIIEVMPIAHD